MSSPLLAALAAPPGPPLAQALIDLGAHPVGDPAEARAICAALAGLEATTPCGAPVARDDDTVATTALVMLASLFQRVEDPVAEELLAREGVPLLVAAYDRRLDEAEAHRDDLLFLLKVFAMVPSQPGLARILAAARAGAWAEDTLWERVLGAFAAPGHPQQAALLAALRDPLPEGFIAVALLDCANEARRSGQDVAHPFDSPPGVALLASYLADPDPARWSFAHSAAAGLAFLRRPERAELLARALAHPAPRVQLEAAWAAARAGEPTEVARAGIERLRQGCLDPRHQAIARAFLGELGREGEVPDAAWEPDLLAQSEMCLWLSHPHEFGRPPDAVRITDTRTLAWPPTNDERQVWLIEYRYEGADPEVEGKPVVGVGMVGSITFSLYGEGVPERPAEELYALHCCWELQIERDPRAPAERSVEAGRALLGWA
ncbi:MAG: hypothetical protein AB7N76_15815 [Planctomycetota bacterium]